MDDDQLAACVIERPCLLLEPTVHSYRAAIQMVDELLALQRDVLPPLQ